MIVAQQFVQEVQGFGADEPLVVLVDEFGVRLARVPAQRYCLRSEHTQLREKSQRNIPAQDLVVMRVQADPVLFDVRKQVVGAQHFGDAHQLVVVVRALEERLFAENLSHKM